MIDTIEGLCALPQMATITDANGNEFVKHSDKPTINPNWIWWGGSDGTVNHSASIALPATTDALSDFPLWRRKSDGTLVRLIETSNHDCYWEAVVGDKSGNVLVENLPRLYEIVKVSAAEGVDAA